MGTNTGNGGFDVDGKNQTFDSVPEGDPGEQPTIPDHGDINVDNTKKDIGENTKITISSYLGKSSKVNKYSLDEASVKSSTTDEKGFPVRLGDRHNTKSFTAENENTSGIVVQQTDLSGNDKILDDPRTKLQIKKGRADGDLPDGHDLLKSVEKNALPDSMTPYVNSVLSNNRFSAAAIAMKDGFINGVITTTDADRRLPMKPNSNHDATFIHPKLGEMTSMQLAQVGVALSIRASAELDSASNNNDPSSFGAQAKALLPSINQSGLSRVDKIKLEADDVLKSLTENEIPETNLVSIAPGGSWGSLNNVHDQFSGINAIGMIALSSALTAGVFLIYEGLSFLIDMINVGPKTLGKTSTDSYVLGRSTVMPRTDPNAFPPSNLLDISSMLGIRPTVHPFKEAINAGTNAFFGVSNSGGLLGQVVGAVVNSTQNPGFNVVVARTIIRSGALVADKLKNVGGNPINAVQGILSVIDEIKTSKLITIMNVFASLGDQLLLDENSIEGKSRIDSESNDGFSTNVTKNRLSGGLKLAWSSNRSPAMYLLPDSAVGMSTIRGLGGFQTGLGLQHDQAKVFYKLLTSNDIPQRGARIPYDSTNPNNLTVKMMEQKLEAEYVPFYMHDLRTNEIISFHAFITALTDDYTPNWEQTEGFGRVDPVRVYKNTSRKVSCGFYVVSTSEEDFADMWVKINKLTTMVYPQYTKGRMLSTSEGKSKIIQPFSQLMSASPLIRLRIGDLIRSNYSRFALARLFGADTNEMVLNDKPIKFEGLLEQFKKKLQEALTNKNGNYTWSLQNDSLAIVNEGGLKLSLPSIPLPGGSNAGGKFSPTFQVDKQDLKFFEFKIVSNAEKGNKSLIVKPSIMSKTDLFTVFGLSAEAASKIISSLQRKYDNSENGSRKVVGGSYNVHADNLMPTLKTINTIKDTLLAENTELSESAIELTNFLNPEKNALVRSFQETRGKGLAGTIDSLSFDYYDNVTWETNINQRAPKICKVNISFTPIHDISPGIDHQGLNRAPIYPLGHYAMDSDNAKEDK